MDVSTASALKPLGLDLFESIGSKNLGLSDTTVSRAYIANRHGNEPEMLLLAEEDDHRSQFETEHAWAVVCDKVAFHPTAQ